jgi:hypothetical protein
MSLKRYGGSLQAESRCQCRGGMYQFAIDMGEEKSYSTAAPKGVEGKVL